MDKANLDKALVAQRQRQIIFARLDYLFRHAWHSIAQERGYVIDKFLATSSHGTLALRCHFLTLGV